MTVYITKEKRKWKIVDKPDGPVSDDLPPIKISDFNVKDQKRLRNIVSPEQLLEELKGRKPKKGKTPKKKIKKELKPKGLASRLKRTKTAVYKKQKAEELEKEVKKAVEKTKPKVVKSPFTASENAPQNIVVSLPKAKPKAKVGTAYSIPSPRREDDLTGRETPDAKLRDKKRYQANARRFAKESADILKPVARKPVTPPAAEPKEPKPLKPRNLKEEKTPEEQAAQAKASQDKRFRETEAIKRGEEEARAKRLAEIEKRSQSRKNARLSAKIREALPKYVEKKKAEKVVKKEALLKISKALQSQARRKIAVKTAAEKKAEKEERKKAEKQTATETAEEAFDLVAKALGNKLSKKDRDEAAQILREKKAAEKITRAYRSRSQSPRLKEKSAEAKLKKVAERGEAERLAEAASKFTTADLEKLIIPSPPTSPEYEDPFNPKKKIPPPPKEPSPKDQPRRKPPKTPSPKSPKEIPPPPKESPVETKKTIKPRERKAPPPPPENAIMMPQKRTPPPLPERRSKAKPPSPPPINVEEYVKESIPKSSEAQAPTLAAMEQREKEIQAELRKSPGDRKLSKELREVKGNIGLYKKTSTKGSDSDEDKPPPKLEEIPKNLTAEEVAEIKRRKAARAAKAAQTPEGRAEELEKLAEKQKQIVEAEPNELLRDAKERNLKAIEKAAERARTPSPIRPEVRKFTTKPAEKLGAVTESKQVEVKESTPPKKKPAPPAPPKLSMREQAEADEKESVAKEIATTKNKLEQSKAKLAKLNPGAEYYPRDKAITKAEIKRYEDRLAALEKPQSAAESKSVLPMFELSEREAKTAKKREPDISIFNKPPPKGSGLGGKLKGHQVNKFVEASYKKLDDANNVGDYVLDRELSTKNNKVYRDPNTGKVVIANAGTSSLGDWWNNKNILFGNYSKTKRFKEVEDIQKKAISKYGKENIMNVGHSQSGEALRIMKRNGLLGEAVAVNPAIIGKSTEDIDVIRSDRDLVSLLTPTSGKDTTIKAQTFNPLTEHSQDIISGENEEKEFGRGIAHKTIFDKIHWGSFSKEFIAYRRKHPEINSLEEFAQHIIENPNHFSHTTLHRAMFYENVIRHHRD